jgi:uncharacterized protein YukE
MSLGPKGNRDNNRDRTWQEMNGVTRDRQQAAGKRGAIKHHNRDIAMHERVNWDVYQHDQLYDMIWSADPATMNHQVRQWHQVAGKIESVTSDVQKTMQALMNNWRGTAAVSAAASNTKLTQWAGDASHTATQIAAGLADYTEAVQYAQHNMPEPAFADAERNFKAGYTVVGTGGASTSVLLRALLSDHLASHEEAQNGKAEAVRVMRNYETQSREAHDALPEFGDSPAMPPQPPPDSPRPAPPQPPFPVTGGQNGGTGQSTAVDPNGSAASTTAASYVDPALASPGGYPGDGYTSGGYPSGGAGYGSAGGPGGVLRGDPGAGAGAAGPLAARAGGIAAESAGLAGLRGTSGGAGGAGGMYPPMAGAGARGDDDGEHTNKYDDGLDLFDDLPPAYPPVFGA